MTTKTPVRVTVKDGVLYNTAPQPSDLTTINAARATRGLPGLTMSGLHQLIAAQPGGGLEDCDWAHFAADVVGR